ncbi:MAG: SpoIIIAH-like family protein [Clostridia bacterium]|nr:SpoIIIAH-like family protein [Clostridia bacterium]
MSVKIRKKQVTLAAMVLALGAAIFINWYYTKPQVQPTGEEVSTSVSQQSENLGDAQYVAATANDDEFATFRLERKTAHDKAEETLNAVIKDSASSQAAVKEATQALKQLSDSIKRESDLETLIKAKTGSSCVVIIDSGEVKVVVEKGVLTDTVTMQIKDLVLNQGKFTPENITIFELNS